MRKVLIIAVAVSAFLALPAISSAAVTCHSTYPAYDLPLHAGGTNCSVAQDVERYATGEWAHAKWQIDGYTWSAALYSRAHNHTYFRYTGHRHRRTATVWITNRYPVS